MRLKFAIHCRQKEICHVYGAVARSAKWCGKTVHVKQNSLLQELLLHNTDEDAARGKQDIACPNWLGVARGTGYER
jgi:hypothetical protein